MLLFDAHNIGYSVYYSMPKLTSDDNNTSVIYGFLLRVKSIVEEFEDNECIFFFDSKKSFRKKEYPGYKDRRKDLTDEEKESLQDAYRQFELLRKEILPDMGFQCFRQIGLEADDLIAQFCNQYSYEKKIIISSDNDLWQLLDLETSQYSIMSRNIMTNESFWEEYNLSAWSWRLVKAWAGCQTDTVQGVKGIGPKTAIKYLNKELKKTTKKYSDIILNNDVFDRNFPIVSLPHKKTKEIKYEKRKLKIKDFLKVFKKYEFYSFSNDAKNWMKLFCKKGK